MNPQTFTRWIIVALIGLGTAVRVPQLLHTLLEAYSFRQAQTAFTVREYAQNGIDLLTSPVPVFGPHSSVPMEFPLFQGIASLFSMAGMPADMASRTLGLISFQATAVLLTMLILRWHGRAVAVLALALFEFLPFGLLWGAASLIDFFSVALSLLMVVGLDRWFGGASRWWLVAASCGAVLGFLVKVTTVPSWGFLVLLSAWLVIRQVGWSASWRRIVIGLAAGPGVGFVGALVWTRYADTIKLQQELTSYLNSGNLREWNFGGLAQRLDPNNYGVILDRVGQEIAGFGLAGLLLAIAAAIFHPVPVQRWRTLAWLLVAVSGPLVFFNLYVVHQYYLIAVYPAIVTAIAIGVIWLVRTLPGALWQRVTVGVVIVALLFTSTVTSPNGRADVGQFATSQGVPGLSLLMRDNTEPSDLIIMIGCNWDPTWLFYAERSGVMMWIGDPQDFWVDHDIADYGFLVSCDGSDAEPYLPAGFVTEQIGTSALYRILAD